MEEDLLDRLLLQVHKSDLSINESPIGSPSSKLITTHRQSKFMHMQTEKRLVGHHDN